MSLTRNQVCIVASFGCGLGKRDVEERKKVMAFREKKENLFPFGQLVQTSVSGFLVVLKCNYACIFTTVVRSPPKLSRCVPCP